jgi:hypothetical protein
MKRDSTNDQAEETMSSPITALPELVENKIQPWKAFFPSEETLASLQLSGVGETAWVQWMKDTKIVASSGMSHPKGSLSASENCFE